MIGSDADRLRRTTKVVCYVVRDGHLLVLIHLDHPLTEAGVQVPAGTVKPGETLRDAALREAGEETGLTGLRVLRALGEADYDIRPYRHEIMRRHFFVLRADGAPVGPWVAGEPDPEGGGPGPRWECRWIPLRHAHVLSGGLSLFVGSIVDDEALEIV